jgi:hypothetical protein
MAVIDSISLSLCNAPGVVEAFFYMSNSPSEERQHVREVRRAFISSFKLDEAMAPPLVEIAVDDGMIGSASPFRLVA